MAKPASTHVCQACGAQAAKWSGRCDNCGAWNTIVEEQAAIPLSGARGAFLPRGKPTRLLALTGEGPEPPRILTGIARSEQKAA